MSELSDFGLILLILAGGFTLALATLRFTAWFPVPAPALFLLGAALISDVIPELAGERVDPDRRANRGRGPGRDPLPRRDAHRLAALPRLGDADLPARDGRDVRHRRVMTVAARLMLGVDWTTAGIIGAALAPTDPAVTFSVLGQREVVGRTGTILEGESGMNDPVGIALMIGILELASHDEATAWVVVEEFAVEMSVGLVFGLAGGYLLRAGDPTGLAAERGPLSAENPGGRRAHLRRHRNRSAARASWPSSWPACSSATPGLPSRPRSGASTARSRASPRSGCSSRSASRWT